MIHNYIYYMITLILFQDANNIPEQINEGGYRQAELDIICIDTYDTLSMQENAKTPII